MKKSDVNLIKYIIFSKHLLVHLCHFGKRVMSDNQSYQFTLLFKRLLWKNMQYTQLFLLNF
jgi:hypothetical protein